jgi:hypothetical protein
MCPKRRQPIAALFSRGSGVLVFGRIMISSSPLQASFTGGARKSAATFSIRQDMLERKSEIFKSFSLSNLGTWRE